MIAIAHAGLSIHFGGYLSGIDFETDGGALSLTFTPERLPEKSRIIRMAFASLTSYMAREKITDYEIGFAAMKSDMLHQFNNLGMNIGLTFEDLLEERIATKARRFNTILNEQDIPKAQPENAYAKL